MQGQGRKATARPNNRLGVVGVKMEFLEEWGFEQLTPEELTRFWSTTNLQPQPNCDLLVSRITYSDISCQVASGHQDSHDGAW